MDALCIKQNGNAARSSQVVLVGLIYGNTMCTLVWLGEPDEYVTGTFDQLDEQLRVAALEIGGEALSSVPCWTLDVAQVLL